MSRATSHMRHVAERLVAYETRDRKSAETSRQAMFLVGEQLPSQLATLLGNVAVRALLSRALALASTEVPWLRAVHVAADGSFHGLSENGAHDADEMREGRVVVLAQLLGLLVAFIGDELTLRLLRDVWPKPLLRNIDFDKGERK